MELKELQKDVSEVFLNNLKRDGIENSDDYLLLKLTEEVGELIQAFLIHQKRCRKEKYISEEESKKELSKELSDVAGLVFVISMVFNIDLEEAIIKKWITREWVKKGK